MPANAPAIYPNWPRQRAWLLLAALIGAGYVGSLLWHPYPFSWLLKALPVLILSGLAVVYLQGRERGLMLLAWLASAAGDIFLDLDRTGYLPQGLGCFLLTQIAFCMVFAARAHWQPSRLAVVAALAIAELALLSLAWPNLGALRIAVMVYLFALLTMSACALMVRPSPWIALGGVSFLIADSLIGINRFVWPFAGSTAVIVSIYLSAQLLIAFGLLRTRGIER